MLVLDITEKLLCDWDVKLQYKKQTNKVILSHIKTHFRVEGAPETCVDALLEASVKYSPHFDWVVAHIG